MKSGADNLTAKERRERKGSTLLPASVHEALDSGHPVCGHHLATHRFRWNPFRFSEAAAKTVAWLVLFVGLAFARGEDYDSKDVYRKKAAFLYFTASDAQWPKGTFDHPNEPFVIGIYGKDPWGGQLQKILIKPIHGRPVKVETVATVADATNCHLLFISAQA